VGGVSRPAKDDEQPASASVTAMNIHTMLVLVVCLTEGENSVTRVEVKMTDGRTHVSSTVPPDIAHIVSMMPPEIFSPKTVPSQVESVT